MNDLIPDEPHEGERPTRPGGRSARVRTAVVDAAWQLVAVEGRQHVSISDVAERAGVHHASVYRRWENIDALILEAAVARLDDRSPVPDTGSLEGDLLAYAAGAAASLEGAEGLTLLRAILAVTSVGNTGRGRIGDALRERGKGIQGMLDRSASRGEPRLNYTDVLDCILAPLYIRRLFDLGDERPAFFELLVETALTRSPTE